MKSLIAFLAVIAFSATVCAGPTSGVKMPKPGFPGPPVTKIGWGTR